MPLTRRDARARDLLRHLRANPPPRDPKRFCRARLNILLKEALVASRHAVFREQLRRYMADQYGHGSERHRVAEIDASNASSVMRRLQSAYTTARNQLPRIP